MRIEYVRFATKFVIRVVGHMRKSEMRKILLFSVIILSAFNIYASTKWTLISNTANGVLFIDASSIQKSGDSYTFWQKTNFDKRQDNGDLSSKVQRTVNCRTRESIYRYMMFYDDIDNNGKLTSSFNPKDDWNPIPPDSVDWAIYQYVCNK